MTGYKSPSHFLEWKLFNSHSLVELTKVRSGQLVLNIATGTGLGAMAAAEVDG
ncbi:MULTISPECIES: hypothetical protein [unclassified Microcoleus]|uniref:hypothetical protein n=1 Tax=unclassified Microcoleus TaxID=2642155 RepID=UPI002FD0043A